MNRPPVCPILLLLAALLIGCNAQAKRDSAGPEAAAALTAPDSPVQVDGAPPPAPIATTSTPPVEPAPTATPSVPPPAGPLDPAPAQWVLLPTVTPTPPPTDQMLPLLPSIVRIPTVTPTPNRAVMPEPTLPADPERHPMATPFYYQTADLAQRGITYRVRTGAGFGLFPFNDVSPCLCRSLDNAQECSREIEEYQLGVPIEGVVRTDECLSIELGDGRIALFNNISDHMVGSVSYAYAEKLADINYHLLHAWYYEGHDYLLVNADSGAVTVVPTYPILSPDKRHFAVIIPPMGSFGHTLIVQVWGFEDGPPHLVRGWRIERLSGDFEGPLPVLAWTDTESFHIIWPTALGQLAGAELKVNLETDGWAIYYNDQPIPQPIVEARTIRFANGGIDFDEFLDTLEVGKPVYIDRDYVYTAVPDELDGATYFRLPQYYYLGEDEDYFPLSVQMANYLQFRVNDDARVYVALDAQVRQLPDWMQSGWQAVDISLETNDIPLQLYRKVYPADTMVELLDRWMQDNRVPSQFIVIVTPDSDG